MTYKELKDLLEKAGVNDDTDLEMGGPEDNPEDKTFWEINYEQGGFLAWFTGNVTKSPSDNRAWIELRACYKDGL